MSCTNYPSRDLRIDSKEGGFQVQPPCPKAGWSPEPLASRGTARARWYVPSWGSGQNKVLAGFKGESTFRGSQDPRHKAWLHHLQAPQASTSSAAWGPQGQLHELTGGSTGMLPTRHRCSSVNCGPSPSRFQALPTQRLVVQSTAPGGKGGQVSLAVHSTQQVHTPPEVGAGSVGCLSLFLSPQVTHYPQGILGLLQSPC